MYVRETETERKRERKSMTGRDKRNINVPKNFVGTRKLAPKRKISSVVQFMKLIEASTDIFFTSILLKFNT